MIFFSILISQYHIQSYLWFCKEMRNINGERDIGLMHDFFFFFFFFWKSRWLTYCTNSKHIVGKKEFLISFYVLQKALYVLFAFK